MGLNIAETKDQLQADWKRGTLTADELTAATDKAIRAYARLKPSITRAVLQTVTDVQEYAKPPLADEILSVAWDRSVAELTDDYPLFPIATTRDTADYPIHHINREAYLDESDGGWEERGDNIVLQPTPSYSDGDVEVIYTRPYGKNDGATEWPDIPSRDIDAIVLLAMAEMLTAEHTYISTLPDYRSGMLSIKRRGSVADMRTAILQLRRDAAQKLGVPTTSSFAIQGRIA